MSPVSLKACDGVFGDFAGLVGNEGQHGAFFAVGSAELVVNARCEYVPRVADDALPAVPFAD